MDEKDHHQRRRRRSSKDYGWVFKLITFLGQVAFWLIRFWFSDRE